MKTVYKDFFRSMDKRIYTTLHSGWIYVSLIFGTIVTWLIKEKIPVILIGGKEFASRSMFTKAGIVIFLLLILTGSIFVFINILGLLFPKYYRTFSNKIDSLFADKTPEIYPSFSGKLTNLACLTYMTVFCYAFFEWLFFATKPSFMDRMSIFGKIDIFFQVTWSIFIFILPLLILFTVLDFLPGLKIVPKNNFRFGLLIPSFFSAITVLLLIDNFTYVIFRIGIINSTGFWRGLYFVIFCWILIKSYQTIQSFPRPKNNPSLSRYLYFAAIVGFLISSIISTSKLPGREQHNIVGPGKSSRTPNIILLGSDGLNAENMSVYGYERQTTPFINELAQSSLVAENNFTNASNSGGSVTSIFTGKSPLTTRVMYPPDILQGEDSYQHLPGILKSLGYKTVELAVPHYLDSYAMNLKDGFDEVNQITITENPLVRLINSISSDEATYLIEQFFERISNRLLHISFIRKMPNPYEDISSPTAGLSEAKKIEILKGIIRDSNQPFFVHVHMMTTHGYVFSPISTEFSKGKEQDKNWMVDFYDDSIHDFDNTVGEITTELEKTGKLENTILIIYTDHAQRWKTTNRIPLIIRFPFSENAGKISGSVQNLDISPTILDYLGIAIPPYMEGQSLLKIDQTTIRPIFSGSVGDVKITEFENGNVIDSESLKAPFYQFGYFTAIYCQKWLTFDSSKLQWSEGTISGYTAPCPDNKLPHLDEMKMTLKKELENKGFDTSVMVIEPNN